MSLKNRLERLEASTRAATPEIISRQSGETWDKFYLRLLDAGSPPPPECTPSPYSPEEAYRRMCDKF